MLQEYYMDLLDDQGEIDITALRCSGCGEVIDRVILKNRIEQSPDLAYGTKRRRFAQRMDKTTTSPLADVSDEGMRSSVSETGIKRER
jgi:hypothetical protein